MIPEEIRQAIESILMVAERPVEPSVLAQLLEVPKTDIEAACDALTQEYAEHGRGFVLVQVAGGYRFQSHPDLAPYVERFVLDGQTSRLSAAALETLAIVAYKQPISRMQIAAIRGVSVDGVLRTLQQREYIDEDSRDPGPGNAVLYGTTDLFLERVGLNSLDDLPPLAEFVPGADVVEALEEGLRPEPLPDMTVETEAGDDAGEGIPGAESDSAEADATPQEPLSEDAEAAVDAPPEAVPDGDAVEEDVSVRPVAEASVDAVEATVEDEAPAEPAGDSVQDGTEDPAIASDVDEEPEHSGDPDSSDGRDPADPEMVADIDLTRSVEVAHELPEDPTDEPDDAPDFVTFDGGPPRSVPATTSPVATIRHDPAEQAEPEPPFRSTPAGGGLDISDQAGMGVDQDESRAVASPPSAVTELGPVDDAPPTV